jgi:RHS repeat-associated protein
VTQYSTQSFTYDAVGNRTDLSAQIGTGNRLDAFNGYSFGYDGEGNQTRKVKLGTEVKNYTWNALGQLTAVRDTTAGTTYYAYDGLGRRVSRTAPNGAVTQYLYDADNLLMELDANGAPVAEYTYYPGVDNPHSVRRGGSMYYYATDNVGTVTGLTNGSRTVVNYYERTPWGVTTYQSEAVPNTLGFMDREYDATTGLYNFRARWYDPQTGRFISQDPIGLAGGINPYAFVGNDPVNFTDPSGLKPCGWVMWTIGVKEIDSFECEGNGSDTAEGGGDDSGGPRRGGGGPGKPARKRPEARPEARPDWTTCGMGVLWSGIGVAGDLSMWSGGKLVFGGMKAMFAGGAKLAAVRSGATVVGRGAALRAARTLMRGGVSMTANGATRVVAGYAGEHANILGGLQQAVITNSDDPASWMRWLPFIGTAMTIKQTTEDCATAAALQWGS